MNKTLPITEQVSAYFGGDDRPEIFKRLESNDQLLNAVWRHYLSVMTEGEIDIQAKELMGLCIAVTKPNEYMINFQQRRLRKVEIDEKAEEEALLVTGLFEGLDGFAHALQVESDLQPGRVLAGDTTRSGRSRVGNVPYVQNSEDPVIREVYDDILAQLEIPAVPKIFEAMAHQPVILQTRWEFYKTIMLQGILPRRTKELIAVAVSAINEGSYCIDVNSAAGRQYGLSEKGLVEAACVIDLFGNLCTLAKGFRLAKRNF